MTVRSVERIREDGCYAKREEEEDEDDRESSKIYHIEPWR